MAELDKLHALIKNVERVLVGKREAIELALVTLLCRGHLLIEDVPGLGKTMLARALAGSLTMRFTRIQFVPDLLPSDVTGPRGRKRGQASFLSHRWGQILTLGSIAWRGV